MKIAISCHPTQGGSGVVATELASALSSRGHEVHLVSCGRPFRLSQCSGVTHHDVGVPDYPLFRYPPHDLSLANKLAGVVEEFDIDIIHAHYAVPHAVSALLARDIVKPRKVRVVTTLHGTDITLVGSHKDFYSLTRHAMISSDAVTAVSTWLQDQTMERFGLPEAPVVIPNFVDTKRFRSNGRARYPSGGEEFHLVHASNLRPVKRIADIIRLFDRIRREVPARMTIFGEGPDRGMAEELVAELDLCKKVTFDGMALDMPEALRSSHLYLLLSHHESFGLSALEAMACGTPVLGSSEGGLKEVVTDHKTGLLCDPDDVKTVCLCVIKDLLTSEEKWSAMSAAAERSAREKFSVDVVVPLYEELYEDVMKEKAK